MFIQNTVKISYSSIFSLVIKHHLRIKKEHQVVFTQNTLRHKQKHFHSSARQTRKSHYSCASQLPLGMVLPPLAWVMCRTLKSPEPAVNNPGNQGIYEDSMQKIGVLSWQTYTMPGTEELMKTSHRYWASWAGTLDHRIQATWRDQGGHEGGWSLNGCSRWCGGSSSAVTRWVMWRHDAGTAGIRKEWQMEINVPTHSLLLSVGNR